MSRAIGIDLGTTNSVVAVLEDGIPRVLANLHGASTTASAVAFTGTAVIVGAAARQLSSTAPDRVVRSVKRHMGSSWTTAVAGQRYTAEQVSARILAKLVTDAEAALGETVASAVITVPAYFNDGQRAATKRAGELAGLTVLRIINEPTSAALCYGLDRRNDTQTVLVFDLGGGTFDVSLLTVTDGCVDVRATAGDNHLGGDDWDAALVRWAASAFTETFGVDISTDTLAMGKLRDAVEDAKMVLSTAPTALLDWADVASLTSAHGLDISRSQFEKLTSPLLARLRPPLARVLEDSGMSPADIDRVVLVGGATRMPMVREFVAKELPGVPVAANVNADEVVALGAAVQAGMLTGILTGLTLADVTPLSLGVEADSGLMTVMIDRNTSVPARRTQVFTTAQDNQPSVLITVFQGERPVAAFNKKLATFELSGIPPVPRGAARIDVTFDIDVNGIVHVSATEASTGSISTATVPAAAGIDADEVAMVLSEARTNAAADKTKSYAITVRNTAVDVLYQASSVLAAAVLGPDTDVLSNAVEELGDALAATSTEAVLACSDAVESSLAQYAAATAPTPPPVPGHTL